MSLVKAWEDSGLPEEDFCTRHGVKPSRLKYWLRRRDRQAGGLDAPSGNVVLIPFDVPGGSRTKTDDNVRLEISGGGLTVRLPLDADRVQLVRALRAVQEVVK